MFYVDSKDEELPKTSEDVKARLKKIIRIIRYEDEYLRNRTPEEREEWARLQRVARKIERGENLEE